MNKVACTFGPNEKDLVGDLESGTLVSWDGEYWIVCQKGVDIERGEKFAQNIENEHWITHHAQVVVCPAGTKLTLEVV